MPNPMASLQMCVLQRLVFSSPPPHQVLGLLKKLFQWTEHAFPQDFYDPQYRSTFNPGASESRWWLGEPVSSLLDMLKCTDERSLTLFMMLSVF